MKFPRIVLLTGAHIVNGQPSAFLNEPGLSTITDSADRLTLARRAFRAGVAWCQCRMISAYHDAMSGDVEERPRNDAPPDQSE